MQDIIQERGRKNTRTGNVVRDRTFNRRVERPTHRYPTRNLIQPVQVLGLSLPAQRNGDILNEQPIENTGIKIKDGDMPPFLINVIIDDKEEEIDLEALTHRTEVLEKQINAVTCPKTGKQLDSDTSWQI